MDNKEKYIIDQINNHRESIDTDDLWANVAGAIPQKEEKKRRGIIWFWGGIFMVMTFGLISYLYINQQESLKSYTGDSKEAIAIQNTDEKNDMLSIIAEVIKEGEPSKKDIASNTLTKLYETNQRTSNNKKIELSTTQKRSDRRITESSNTILVDAENYQSVGAINGQTIDNDMLSIYKESVSNVSLEQDDMQAATAQSRIGKNKFDRVFSLVPLDFSKLDFERKVKKIEHENHAKVDLVRRRSKMTNRWSVFMNTGVSYVSRELSTENIEFVDRVNRRDGVEQVLGGWDFLAGVAYQVGPAFNIASGLSIGQIHERATYSTSYLVESQTDQVTAIIHEQDGNITSLTENVTSYTNRETNEIRFNTLKYYSIPLILKYRLIENENYKLLFNTNITYSFSQQYTGTISYGENEEAYDMDLDIENNFNRSGAMSIGLGFEASRKISNSWDFNLGLSARRLQGISSNSNPISQKYNLLTLNFGVSKKI